VFDLDGTLIEGHVRRRDGDSGPFEEVLPFPVVKPLPGRIEKVNALLDADVKVAIATNKAGVAWGHITIEDCVAKRRKFEREFRITELDELAGRFAWYEAYGHPGAPDKLWGYDDPDRKPRPGMLLRAMVAFGEEPATTMMVGDMDFDREAAERAGVEFHWAQEYF
jgi:D-glycero-D-manno-heptose 1,7-bisphosphate phosphatase